MVRLALHSSDMTATCAVPPGNPTSQATGGWQMLKHVGNSGLVQSLNVQPYCMKGSVKEEEIMNKRDQKESTCV